MITDLRTAATPAQNGDAGPNLVVVAFAAGLVALLLIAGYLIVRHVRAMLGAKRR